MQYVKGFLNYVDGAEYSKLTDVKNFVKKQMMHVAWECPKCEEINVEFKFKHPPMLCKCDSCKTKFPVIWEPLEETKPNLLDEPVVEGEPD